MPFQGDGFVGQKGTWFFMDGPAADGFQGMNLGP